MTKARASAVWMISLLALLITASQSWQTFSVTDDAGGGVIQVSGFLAFPAIGALIALQVTALLVGLLVKPIVLRWITLGISSLMLWNLIEVVQNHTIQLQRTFSNLLADQTGVLTDPASSEFLIASSQSPLVIVFAFLSVLNLLVLLFISIKSPTMFLRTKTAVVQGSPEDLWSNQS